MKQYYQSERMSALKTVDDAIKNPSFWKTPLGIAAGTLQYVMSPISAVAKTAGAAVEEATGELLKTPMVNVEDAAQRDPLTQAEKTIAGDVAKFVGKLGVMLSIDAPLALAALAFMPIMVVAINFFRLAARQTYRLIRERIARLNAYLQEALSGMMIVQLFAARLAATRSSRP